MNDREYERALGILFSPKQWFQFPMGFLKFMTANEAIMLSYLMGQSEKYNANSNGGWFFRMVSDVQEELGLKEDAQRRAIDKLQEAGWLKMKLKGAPPVRHFKINLAAIARKLVEVKSGDVKDSNPADVPDSNPGKVPDSNPADVPDSYIRDRDTTKEVSRKKRTSPVKARRRTNGPHLLNDKQLDSFCVKWGRLVRRVVKEHDPTSKMASAREESYARCIRDLKSKGGYSEEQIAEVLEWYIDIDNYSDEFTRKIRSSNDLYHGFGAIRDAKARSEQEGDLPAGEVEGIRWEPGMEIDGVIQLPRERSGDDCW